MTRLIVVRHGESEANRKEIFAGHTDAELTDFGRLQAEKLSGYLKNYEIDRIYSSDLKRAYNTAYPTAKVKGIEIEKNENLREIFAGKWEGEKFEYIYNNYNESFLMWLNDIGKAICDEGESVVQLKNRIENEIKKIVRENEGKTVMVVSHGTPIRSLSCIWNDVDICDMQKVRWVPNASVSIAEYESADAKPKIVLYGYDEFLEGATSNLPANV